MTRRKKLEEAPLLGPAAATTCRARSATKLYDNEADCHPRISLVVASRSTTTNITCENVATATSSAIDCRKHMHCAIYLHGLALKMRLKFKRARLSFPRRPLVTLLALCVIFIARPNHQTINCQAVAGATSSSTESGADLAAASEFQQLRPTPQQLQITDDGDDEDADEPKASTTTTTTTSTTRAPKSERTATTVSSFHANDDAESDERASSEHAVTTGGGHALDWLAATTEGVDEAPTPSEPPFLVTDRASAAASDSDLAESGAGANQPQVLVVASGGDAASSTSGGSSQEDERTTTEVAAGQLGASSTNAELQQLVRSRKSPESNNNNNNGSNWSAPAQVPLRQGRPLVANSSANLFAGGQQTPSTLDYDDFDLDYQLKLDQVPAPPPPLAISDKPSGGLNKREFDQESAHAGLPAWSALLAGEQASHLFKSTASPLNSTGSATPGSPNQAHLLQQQHSTPPIMPSLLTISSGQLSHQELSKARPHFLFYPDQYSEFGGLSSYHQSAAEALANGDLLATASDSANQLEQVAATAPVNQSTSWRHSGRPPPPVNSVENATAPSANSSSSAVAGQMISLLNGSPILNKQSLYDNLARHRHHHQNHYSQAPQVGPAPLGKLNRPKLMHTSASELPTQPAVTTIVVDNLATATTTQVPQVVRTTATPPATSTTTTSAPLPSGATETSVSSTTSESAATSSRSTTSEPPPPGNSSRAHQWFNYPHPNLHHNPLLLHHILNKPASFYSAQGSSGTTTGGHHHHDQQQQQNVSPGSMFTPTTTEMLPPAATPQPPVVGPSRPNPIISTIVSSAAQASGTNSPPNQLAGQPPVAIAPNAINIIERPTYGPAQHAQQQPVNLTLLQMQINEMRAIASQEGANRQQLPPMHQKQHAQQIYPGQAPRTNGPSMMPAQPPVNVLHHLLGNNMLPPTTTSYNGQPSQQAPQWATTHHILAQHQQQPRVRLHPQIGNGNLHFGRKPNIALATRVIGAPSFLQEVYTPSPSQQQLQQQHTQSMSDDFNKSLLAHQTASGQPQHENHAMLDSLSVSASMASSQATTGDQPAANQTGMSEEDMSTYVALLASLSTSPVAGKPGQLDEPSDNLDSLLESLLGQTKTGGNETQAQFAFDELELAKQQNSEQQNKLQAQSWIELLKSAKLIGLSDEVQARIYREYLAPLVANSSPGSAGLALTANGTATTTTTTRRPAMAIVGSSKQVGAPAESSRTFAAVAPPTLHASLPSQPARGAGLSDQRNFYSLDPTTASATLKQQQQRQQQVGANQHDPQVEALRQSQRQVAFIEAVRLSLAQMVAANESAHAKDALAESGDQQQLQEEGLADSGSRPQPEWRDHAKPAQQISLVEGATHLHQQQVAPPASSRPSLFPHMRAPLFRAPPIGGLLRGPAAATTASTPVPLYPWRSLWSARHHYSSGGSGGSGPQPRLLWPVSSSPPPHPMNDATSGRQHQQQLMLMQAQPTIPLPLVRLGPVVPLQPPAMHLRAMQPPPPPPGQSMTLAPNRVMLDRFPMAAAPAYLVKLPTLTGGTITASGSLVPPMPKFWRRPPGQSLMGPPAAFISASPLGALRFLNALAPPRMRFTQPPPPLAVASLPLSTAGYAGAPASGQLQSAPSTLHVGHSAPSLLHYYGPPMGALHPAHNPSPGPHHLHQLYHEHHQRPVVHHAPRLQVYIDGTAGPTVASDTAAANLDSPTATATTTTTISSAGSAHRSPPASAGHGERQPGVSATAADQQQQQQQQSNPNALTRLQQATLSLVELSSLASLLDEVVGGGSDSDASPAMALATAISSLSAAQNAAAQQQQQHAASSHATSERIVPSSSNGAATSTSNNNLQQQAGALFWRNLLMPGLFRQSGGKHANGGGGGRLRDLSALERLLAHTHNTIGYQHGGINTQGGRLKVKYIRVPVAVYETVPAGGTTGGLDSPTGSSPAASGGETPNSSDATPQSGNSAAAAAAAHSSGSPAAAPTSNEFFFDEMSAESGPQTHYLSQHFDPNEARQTANHAHLGYLPIVRPVPQSQFMFRPQSHPHAQDLYSLAASSPANSIQSLLEAENQQVAAAAASSESGKGKRKKKKRRGRKNKHNGEDDDDDEDEDDEGESEDDDAISPSDLPIIESLISTIIHGGPQQTAVSYATSGQDDPLATSASGWRALRAKRPFGLGGGGGSRHAQKLMVSPEASSNVFTYAHPSDVLSTGGATRFTASSSPSNPFNRQRFSLGEVVGALGARKLISSLLGRRTKTARASKQRPSSGSVQHHHHSRLLDSSTRTPPRDLLMLRPGRAQHTAAGNSSLRRRGLLGGWRAPTTTSRLVGNSKPGAQKHHNRSRTRTGGTGSTLAPASTAAQANTFSPHGDVARPSEWTSTRKPRPLVYASMAAYDFEPWTAKSRLKRTRTSPRPPPAARRPALVDASIVSAGPAETTTAATPSTKSNTRKPPTGSSLMADSSSTTQDKMEYSFYLSTGARQRANSSSTSRATLTDAPRDGPHTTIAQNDRFKDTTTTAADQGARLVNATIVQLFASKPRSASTTSTTVATPAAMPIYHIVADHYQKANSGHHRPAHSQETLRPQDTSSSKSAPLGKTR